MWESFSDLCAGFPVATQRTRDNNGGHIDDCDDLIEDCPDGPEVTYDVLKITPKKVRANSTLIEID